MAKLSLQQQAEKVLAEAEAAGLKQNFFFVTVTKEYVKNRGNVYTHPAVTEYNRTATAANGTVITLIKILDAFKGEGETSSKLQAFIDSLNE